MPNFLNEEECIVDRAGYIKVLVTYVRVAVQRDWKRQKEEV